MQDQELLRAWLWVWVQALSGPQLGWEQALQGSKHQESQARKAKNPQEPPRAQEAKPLEEEGKPREPGLGAHGPLGVGIDHPPSQESKVRTVTV